MPKIRLVPSTIYNAAGTDYLQITNADNANTNTDSDTYATIYNRNASTSNRYCYLRGFNFGDIPSDATVTGFRVLIKGRESGISTSSSYQPYLANGTSAINGSVSPFGTTATVKEFTGISASWATIKGYGANFGIRLNVRRNSRNTAGYMYIYGAEIEVTYTLPVYNYTLYEKISGVYQPVNKAFKKVSGAWVEQTELQNVFENGKKYINGDWEHILITDNGGPLLTSSGEKIIIS